ncbi:MAG: hypothetical protein WC503_00635 [Candidatus Shapirobacteria bacterium]
MFEDLVDESKFKHLEEDCGSCTGEECAVGACAACSGSCQPEVLEDELPMSFLQSPDLKQLTHLTLEDQMYLKYHVGYNIQKFYMPAFAYDCLEKITEYPFNGSYGIYKFCKGGPKSVEIIEKGNLRTILIKRQNNAGKPIEYIELVELY